MISITIDVFHEDFVPIGSCSSIKAKLQSLLPIAHVNIRLADPPCGRVPAVVCEVQVPGGVQGGLAGQRTEHELGLRPAAPLPEGAIDLQAGFGAREPQFSPILCQERLALVEPGVDRRHRFGQAPRVAYTSGHPDILVARAARAGRVEVHLAPIGADVKLADLIVDVQNCWEPSF